MQTLDGTVDGNWNRIESHRFDLVVANDLVTHDIATDRAGSTNARIQGAAVDIGAYEAPEASAPLASFASLVALAVQRRLRDPAPRVRRYATRASTRVDRRALA